MPPALALAPEHDLRPGYSEAERREALEWLGSVDDAFLACRGRHNFPKLLLHNGVLPDGIRADRQRDRSYQITETCPDCGTKRTYSTVPDGWLGGLKPDYKYDWPDGYRVPKGAMSHITISDMKAEQWRRVLETLDAQADREAAAGSAPAAPAPARFASA